MLCGPFGHWFIWWVKRRFRSTFAWLCRNIPVPLPLSQVLCSKVSSRGKRPRCSPFLHISCSEALRGISRLSQGCLWAAKNGAGRAGWVDQEHRLPPVSTQELTVTRVFTHFSNVGLQVSDWCTVLPHPPNRPEPEFLCYESFCPYTYRWVLETHHHSLCSDFQSHILLSHLWLLRK